VDREIPAKTVAVWGGYLFGGLLLVVLLCYTLYWFRPSHGEPEVVLTRTMSDPALQPDPDGDMAKFLATEEEALTQYSWLNKDAGVVRLPIDRAKELVLERGFPVRGSR
jgi:hypothetical protein